MARKQPKFCQECAKRVGVDDTRLFQSVFSSRPDCWLCFKCYEEEQILVKEFEEEGLNDMIEARYVNSEPLPGHRPR